jgi:hypothetical protein
MKSLFKILLSLLLYISAQGQTYFNKTYDFLNIPNNAGSHLLLPNHSILLPTTYNQQNGVGTIAFLYSDTLGDTLFSKTISSPNTFYNISSASPVYDTYDSAIAFACASIDGSNNMNSFICKLNLNGDTIWTINIDSLGYDLIHAILVDTNDYIFIGLTNSFGSGLYDVLFVKISKTGIILQTTAIGTAQPEAAISACFSSDGNILISGAENSDDLLMKIDRNGNLIWRHTYPLGMGQCFVTEAPNSDILLSSSTAGPANTDNLVLRKTNSNGTIIWERTYINTNAYVASTNSLYISQNGFLYLTTTSTFSSVSSGVLWCFSPTGDSLWSAQYTSTSGLDAYFYDLSPFPGGGFLMSGFADTPNQYNNAWLVRVDSNGCLVPGCPNSVEELELDEDMRIMISPNPANDLIHLAFTDQLAQGSILIYNAAGAVIMQEEYSSTINISALSEGIYFIRYQMAHGGDVCGKIIISR